MNEFKEQLEKSLQTGFIDRDFKSKTQIQPDFILNDKLSQTKVLPYVLQRLDICKRFWFSAAFLTTSGVACLHNALKRFSLRDAVSGKIYVSDYQTFTEPLALRRINQFPNIEVRLLTNKNFHGKGYLFEIDEQFDCLVGSSNLTASALCKNDELNIHLTSTSESKFVERFLENFDKNFNQSKPLVEEILEFYQKKYEEKIEAINSATSNIDLKDSTIGEYPIVETEKINSFDESIETNNPKSSAKSEDKNTNLYSSRENRPTTTFSPNLLQNEATKKLRELRIEGADRALVVSATATGKTFLSAFDVQQFGATRVLFIVHRLRIAKKAMETFKAVFGKSTTYGIYSADKRQSDRDFIFSTIQTINNDQHLKNFEENTFDYIIIDETHRAGAKTYQKILEYFKPKFILGMTATPERTDDYNIFSLFNYNIACEIRLPRAMEEDLVCPFHYFGISDLKINGEEIDEKSDFNNLISDQRINHIINALREYGTDSGVIRGLIFCSTVEEAKEMSIQFNKRNFNTIALSGDDPETSRANAMERIELSSGDEKLDYIFTVDIFNEGIDIPSINQIVMLRPTQSAIIFVQQLGRGLRNSDTKEYLTVIDFIGNYEKNYLIPVALYGDRSLNKDTLRKLVASGSNLIPGSSTINFDEITKEKIFTSIDKAQLKTKRDLISDYRLLRFRLGRPPMMMDFLEHGSREPFQFVEYSGSFFNFALFEENENDLPRLSDFESTLLEKLCKLINNSVRGLDSLILIELLQKKTFSLSELSQKYREMTGLHFDKELLKSVVHCLNFNFNTEVRSNKYSLVSDIYNYNIVKLENDELFLGNSLEQAISNPIFVKYLQDSSKYSLTSFLSKLSNSEYVGGFIRYSKYRRVDVLRILNWSKQEVNLNIGGYKVSSDNSNCPIFVTYKKSEEIAETIKYEDAFVSPDVFSHMSKTPRTLSSPEVQLWMSQTENNIRLPLFIKKSDDEGEEHYFVGDLLYVEGSASLQSMAGGSSVVNCRYNLDKPVEENLYRYLIA